MLKYLKKILLLIVFYMFSSQIYAHAVLEYSEPARRSILYRSPEKIVLTFNEPVEIEFSKIDLLDVEDKIIISGIRPIAMQNKNSITIPIPLLTYGIYFVEFQVLSIDGHKVKGRYKFTIKNIN
jgi:copper resistance protein C|tara:strand:- start:402 stop:773 length:372 start_codon:yes stop_codon:yes gene_type:complete